MRRVFSIVLAVGSLAWGGAQAQSAAPGAAPATAPAAAAPTAPTAEPAPAPGPASEPAVSPSEPSPASGSAEPPPPPVAPQFPVPTYEKPPVPTEWDQPTYPPAQAARSRRTSEASFELHVPVWFTPDEGAIDPGFGFAGRFGLVLGRYFVPELHLGWQINWLDDDVVGPYDLTMDTFWVSAGMRFRFDSGGLVTPFVSAAFDMNFVHLEGNEEIVCGYYYCDSVASYEFTPGFSGKVGLAFEMSKYTAIDVGARIAMMFEGDVFPHAEGYVSPFVGVTFYN